MFENEFGFVLDCSLVDNVSEYVLKDPYIVSSRKGDGFGMLCELYADKLDALKLAYDELVTKPGVLFSQRKSKLHSIYDLDLVAAGNLASITFGSIPTISHLDLEGRSICVELFDLFNTLYTNGSELQVILHCSDFQIIVPPMARFILTDYSMLRSILTECYIQNSIALDVLLIDFPWGNKSARRSSNYGFLDYSTLLRLPVDKMLHDGSIVALWVTNNAKIHSFVKNRLFPCWRVSFAAIWIWVKVTSQGIPVIPMDHAQRKPFECLIIGQRNAAAIPSKAIVSVPCSHSKKPFVHSLLASHADVVTGQKMELFARQMTRGWTSWGNEAIKFDLIKNH